jgi:uncharacterized protein YqeY
VPDPVSLRDRLQSDIAVAMRGGDTLRRDTLRMAASAAYNVEKRNGHPLTEDEFLAVLSREVKTRRESVEAFRAGGREDLATKEEAEIEILSGYLPLALTEDEIGGLIQEAIRPGAVRATWRVMGWLAPRTRGRRQARQRARRRAHEAPTSLPRTTAGLAEAGACHVDLPNPRSSFTRGDASRLTIAAVILILAITAILGVDILPDEPLEVNAGELAPQDILAPRAIDFVSVVQTSEARAAARAAVEPQYDFTSENAIAIARSSRSRSRTGRPDRYDVRPTSA